MEPEIRHFATMEQLNQAVAVNLLAFSHECVRDYGLFSVALAGGNTPLGLYELLSTPQVTKKFPLFNTHFFWGDERFVPHDDPMSNVFTVKDTLLSLPELPLENIHPIQTQNITPEESATAYEAELKAYFSQSELDLDIQNPNDPLFDVILLGVGADGHTASLFPGTDTLNEQTRWVAPASAPENVVPRQRVTLTLPIINRSRHVYFIVSGKSKSAIVSKILDTPEGTVGVYPAAQVRAQDRIIWFLHDI